MRWGAGQVSPPCSDSSCVRGAALLAGDPRSQPQCEGALRSSLIKGPLTPMMHRLFELGSGVTWPNQDWKERQEKLMIRCRLGPLNAELLHFQVTCSSCCHNISKSEAGMDVLGQMTPGMLCCPLAAAQTVAERC